MPILGIAKSVKGLLLDQQGVVSSHRTLAYEGRCLIFHLPQEHMYLGTFHESLFLAKVLLPHMNIIEIIRRQNDINVQGRIQDLVKAGGGRIFLADFCQLCTAESCK